MSEQAREDSHDGDKVPVIGLIRFRFRLLFATATPSSRSLTACSFVLVTRDPRSGLCRRSVVRLLLLLILIPRAAAAAVAADIILRLTSSSRDTDHWCS